jgi:DNA-binding MarR family transcriptional regulator
MRRFVSFSEQAARDHGLTPAQHQLLLMVRGAEAAGTTPSTSDIAESLQLRLHSAGELIGRAVDNDLLVRHVDPDDRRRTFVELTDRGRAKLEDLSVLHRRELRQFRTEITEFLDSLDL